MLRWKRLPVSLMYGASGQGTTMRGSHYCRVRCFAKSRRMVVTNGKGFCPTLVVTINEIKDQNTLERFLYT